MKHMRKTLFLLIIISMILIAGCATPTNREAKSNFPNENQEEKKDIIPDIIPEKINYDLVESNFKYEGTTYIPTPKDEFGDESSLNRITTSTDFEIATRIKLTYNPDEKQQGRTIPIQIKDTTSEEVVYTGTLLEGTHEYDVIFTINHAGMAPRFEVCFGDEICTQLRGEIVDNNLDLNLNNIWFKLETGIREKSIILSNKGTTVISTYIVLPKADDFLLETSENIITLKPQSEKRITISASGTRTNGKETGIIYAIADSCDISEECATTAKIKKEFDIAFS